MKKFEIISAVVGAVFLAACPAKHAPPDARTVKAETWPATRVQAAVVALADDYRKNGDAFFAARDYVWAGRWTWPETVGVNEKHLPLLKKMFSEGDDATKVVVLNVILMNVPASRLENEDKSFMSELVLLDTEMRERRANVPPPTFHEEIIEEYVPTTP